MEGILERQTHPAPRIYIYIYIKRERERERERERVTFSVTLSNIVPFNIF